MSPPYIPISFEIMPVTLTRRKLAPRHKTQVTRQRRRSKCQYGGSFPLLALTLPALATTGKAVALGGVSAAARHRVKRDLSQKRRRLSVRTMPQKQLEQRGCFLRTPCSLLVAGPSGYGKTAFKWIHYHLLHITVTGHGNPCLKLYKKMMCTFTKDCPV